MDYSANRGVDRYRSPVSGSRTTMVLPADSGRWAICRAAHTAAPEEIVADVSASNQRIAASTGVTPTLIRCPYGEYDDHVISAIRSMGMEPIQWNVEQPEMT